LRGANYELLKHEAMELERRASSRTENDLDDRYEWMVRELKNIDSKYQDKFIAKVVKEAFVLNTEVPTGSYGGGNNSRNGGGGGRPNLTSKALLEQSPNAFKEVCSNTLRKGYCTEVGCKKRGISKEWFNKRGECNATKKGIKCRFEDGCRFRHPEDAKLMTDAMERQCVHKKSVNAAAEVDMERVD
jgi:hypothetical protein